MIGHAPEWATWAPAGAAEPWTVGVEEEVMLLGPATGVEAIDVLVRCGAIPEPSFVWWDVRLKPLLGTIEIRVMDARTRVRDTGALAALVQCLVRLEATEGFADPSWREAPEALDENRFLAARDGMAAQFVDPSRDRLVPALGPLAMVIDSCWPHAVALGCERELGTVASLAGDWGAARQRAIAGDPGGLGGLVAALRSEFSPPRPVIRDVGSAQVAA